MKGVIDMTLYEVLTLTLASVSVLVSVATLVVEISDFFRKK